jgi:DNA-binding response OmpR family regulator
VEKKILIIEDDRDMCSELKEALTDLDYQVQTAFDGLAGKKLMEKNIYDIIILDLKIPKFDGYQILDFIGKIKINSKIIVITARMKIDFEDIINHNQEKNEEDLLKIANQVLLKPFYINDLISIINKL